MLSKKNLGLRGLMKLKPKGVSKVQSNKEVPTAKTEATEKLSDSKVDDISVKSNINDKVHEETNLENKSNNIQAENTLTKSNDVNVPNTPGLPITSENTSIDTVTSVPIASHVGPPKSAPITSNKKETVITKNSKNNKDDTISSNDIRSLNKSLAEASENNVIPSHRKKDSEKENGLIKLPTCKANLEHSVYKKRKSNYQSKVNAGDLTKDNMSVFDLIFYNPEGKPMSNRHKYENSRKRQRKNTNTTDADGEESLVDTPDDVSVCEADKSDSGDTVEKVTDGVADDNAKEDDSEEECDDIAPQLKFGPNGEIIIDQESLVIKQTVDEERLKALKTNAIVDEYTQRVYTKKRKRAQDWTINETAHFYKALSTVGTDFSLMKDLFFKKSPRDRAELKVKFKKEEKLNRALIDSALGDSYQYDLTTFEHQTEFDAEADRANVKQALKEDMKKKKEMQRLAEQKERILEKEQKKLRKQEEKQRKSVLRNSKKPKPAKVGRPRKSTAVLQEDASDKQVPMPDDEDKGVPDNEGVSELKTPARRSSRPQKKRKMANFEEFLDDECEMSDNSDGDADYEDSMHHDSQLTSTAVKKIPKRVQKRVADDSFAETENQGNTTVLSYDGGMELPSSANITEIINNPEGCLSSINLHEISLASETGESPSSTVQKSKKSQNSFSRKKSTDSSSTPKRKRKRVNVVSSSSESEEEELNNLENNEHIKVVENSGQTIKLELINFKMNAVTGELSNDLKNGKQSDCLESISGDESIREMTSQSTSQANSLNKAASSEGSDSKDISRNCYERKPCADSNDEAISSVHEDVEMVNEVNTEPACHDDGKDSKTEDKICDHQHVDKIGSKTETNIQCSPKIDDQQKASAATNSCQNELKGEENESEVKQVMEVKSTETGSSECNNDETKAKVVPKSSTGFKGRFLKKLKPMTTIKKSALLKSNIPSKEENLKPITVLDNIEQSNSENNKISSSEDMSITKSCDEKLDPKLEHQKDRTVDKHVDLQDESSLQEKSCQESCKLTVPNSLILNESEENTVNESKNIKSFAVKPIEPPKKSTKSGLGLRNFKKIRPTSKKNNESVPVSDSKKVSTLPPKIGDEIKITCKENNDRNVNPCINTNIESCKNEIAEVSECNQSHSSGNVQIQSEFNLQNTVNRLQTSLQNDVVIVSEVEPQSSSIRSSDIDVIHCTIPPKTNEKASDCDSRDVRLIDLTSEIHQRREVTNEVVHSVGINIRHDSPIDLRESPVIANRFPTVQTSALPLYAPCQSSFGTNPSPSLHSINDRFAPIYQQPLMTSHITSPHLLDRNRPHSAFSLPTPRTFLQTPPLSNSFCSAEPQITAIIDSRPASAGPQNLSKNITKRFNFALSDILIDCDGKQIVRVPRSNNLFVNIPVPTLPKHARGVTVLKSPVIKDGRKAWTYNLYPL